MKLNLKYYKGTDEYSDVEIDKIIEFIKKYPDDYEQAFEEDCSWPVFYHLSNIRKNVISWYPFKENCSILEVGASMGAITGELVKKCGKVTSIELSKRRATAILERNKNAKNLEIIVGNFKDIKLTEKYDYILLNGVLEYAALYMDTDNPYVDFINKLKSNLKPSGKILIAIENRMGLKYWCGAGEDHLNVPYLGINNYINSTSVRTFDRTQLCNIFDSCKMKYNFYYMFPDYKFTDVIVTDKFLKKNNYFDYCPYYFKPMTLLVDEYSAFDSVRNNNAVSYMANSFFIELSFEKIEQQIEYVKYNNYRNKKYNLMNYIYDNKFYKEALYDESISHINTIKNIYNNIRTQDFLPLEFENNRLSCDIIDFPLLKDIIDKYLKNGDEESIFDELSRLFDYLKNNSGKLIKNPSENIFKKYDVKIDNKLLNELHFYEDGLIDLIPSNIFISDDNKYIIIDQEWYEKNCPIEYCYYRIISNTFTFTGDRNKFLAKFNLTEFENVFLELEKSFLNSVVSDKDNYYCEYKNNRNIIDDFSKNEKQNEFLKEEYNKLKNEKELIDIQLNNIYNSKGYKLLNKLYKIKDKVRRK